jgi:hypothetical protein
MVALTYAEWKQEQDRRRAGLASTAMWAVPPPLPVGVLWTSHGPPIITLGSAGDWAIDVDDADRTLYGPKLSTGWPDGIRLRGPEGPVGSARVFVQETRPAPGDDVPNGSLWVPVDDSGNPLPPEEWQVLT